MNDSPPYSKTRTAGDLVFSAGHVGKRDDGRLASGIVAQTQLALVNLESSLGAHGLDRSDVVRTTVYLADMDLWPAMNEPYRQFFDEPFPARSALAVGLPEGILFEIDAIAWTGAVERRATTAHQHPDHADEGTHS